ncbi:MAG: small multi-drug export protein [Candidatus Nezhaarchaeales archaeon]
MSSFLDAQALPGALAVFLTSLLPLLEARAAVPLGLALGLSPPLVLSVSVIGNALPVPLLLLLLNKLEALLVRRLGGGGALLEGLARPYLRLVQSARRRAGPYVNKYGALGLAVFTAIPLPLTGAWTASLAAYALGVEAKRAALSIWLGVLAAALAVYSLTFAVGWTRPPWP